MNTKFSIYAYSKLSQAQRFEYNKILSQRLNPIMKEIRIDDVLCSIELEHLLTPSVVSNDSETIVSELFCRTSAGVQAGNGNQSLYLDILNAICESWKQIQ